MIYTRKHLEKQLATFSLKNNETLLVHSSMKSIGHVEFGAEEVLNVLSDFLSNGLLIFPTHTWASVNDNNPIYNLKTEKSCVGILTNLFLQREGVVRSCHPTHSVAALGKSAKDYIKADRKGNTPCSREGCWGKLYDLDAKIMFLGCSLKRNTLIHGVEEWNDIPNRLSKKMTPFKVRVSATKTIDRPCYTHYSPIPDISENYDIIEEAILKTGAAEEGHFGNARVILCRVRPMVDLVSTFLQKNPDVFLTNKTIPSDWYADLVQ